MSLIAQLLSVAAPVAGITGAALGAFTLRRRARGARHAGELAAGMAQVGAAHLDYERAIAEALDEAHIEHVEHARNHRVAYDAPAADATVPEGFAPAPRWRAREIAARVERKLHHRGMVAPADLELRVHRTLRERR